MKRPYQIAIDGPAASGKSVVSKLLASKLNFLYIDTGAMYRAATLYLIENKLLVQEDRKLKINLKKVKISFSSKGDQQLVFLNNKDVTREIRASLVSKFVSQVSSMKLIRTEMVKRQRRFALRTSVVMDGRDIGTSVLVDADLKIYLTASLLVRAARRLKDLRKISEKVQVKRLKEQIQARDNYDSSRTISPLCCSQDAMVIDTTNLSVNEVLDKIRVFLPFEINVDNHHCCC